MPMTLGRRGSLASAGGGGARTTPVIDAKRRSGSLLLPVVPCPLVGAGATDHAVDRAVVHHEHDVVAVGASAPGRRGHRNHLAPHRFSTSRASSPRSPNCTRAWGSAATIRSAHWRPA